MAKFINLTPHTLNVEGVGALPPSGSVARCAARRTLLNPIAGVRVTAQTLGDVEGLPGAQPDTIFLVSALVVDGLKKAGSPRVGVDVFAPDTGPDAIRKDGVVVGVLGLTC